MRAFLAALRFLTILPVPGAHRLPDEAWGEATAWYPAAGLVLGLLLASLDAGLRWLWPTGVAAALLLAGWVILTGALHLDGFVDCCDALPASDSPQRRLEILRDVHTGAFGLVGAVLLLLAKFTALVALPVTVRLATLLLVPTLGRWAMTAAVVLHPYARSGSGLGQKAKTGAGYLQLVIASGIVASVCSLAWCSGLGWAALGLLALSGIIFFFLARWIRSRIGGLTGDAYGAICELVETVNLLALAALTHRGFLQ